MAHKVNKEQTIRETIPMTKDQLDLLIDSYLTTRRESVDAGWPEVTKTDRMQLLDIIYNLIELKYGRDCDNDQVMQFTLCDRSKERWLYPRTIPHKHGHEKIKKLSQAIKSASDEMEFEMNNIKEIIPLYEREE